MLKRKNIFVLLLVLVLAAAVAVFAACTAKNSNENTVKHIIGVPTYDVTNPQVVMFKNYLDTYISECYPDVEFIYSRSMSNYDDMEEFFEYCAENGVEGILALTSYDMKKEISFCDEHKMYYVRASGTTADADFEAMSTKPYYVGEIGPGKDIEYASGRDMVLALAKKGDGNNYMVVSGGASLNNEMHRLRTVAILETLAEVYGGEYDLPAEELAVTTEVKELTLGDTSLVIVPGYFSSPEVAQKAEELAASGKYSIGLAVTPIDDMIENKANGSVSFGIIDFFSDTNLYGFDDGSVCYVAGKFRSEIGPAFAAIYNAITGNGDFLRVDGKAFRLTQGFWNASGKDEYNRMYGLAAGKEINAYNYEDLLTMIKETNPGVTFESFKALTEAYDYDSCAARRSAR